MYMYYLLLLTVLMPGSHSSSHVSYSHYIPMYKAHPKTTVEINVLSCILFCIFILGVFLNK